MVGLTWGSKDENINAASELPRSTMQQDSVNNAVPNEGLTEKILFVYDPLNPLGRRRFVFYNILFFLGYFAVLFLMAILLSPGDPLAVIDIP